MNIEQEYIMREKREKNRLPGLLMTVAVMGLFGLATALAQTTNTYSGQATGINANVSVLGSLSVNTTVAQTDALPPAGGEGGGFTKQVVSASVLFGALGTTNHLNTGIINTMTSGGNPPTSSQSQASVATLDALLLTNSITADEVRANTVCTCQHGVPAVPNLPNCTGSTTITNLRINGVLIDVSTTTAVPLLGGVGTVFINEQTVSGTGQTRAITVNALRISINSPDLLVADIIISQAKSDITCASGATDCTPTTTVTEGDLFPGGIPSFGVASGPNSVTVDHVNAGSGLQSFTVVGTPTNAIVTIQAFTPGTFNPVAATFTAVDPSQPVDFTLRAGSLFHAIFIRARCGEACTPTATVTEGDLFPGGLPSFGVTSGPDSVTVDHVNAGAGLQSFTVVGTPTNAIVTIPAFTPGTFNPVTATYTVIDPSLPVDVTLRAASTFHSIFIRVRCSTDLNTFSGRATAVNATILGINATLVDTGPLPASGGVIIATPLLSANVLGGALTTGLLTATTQGAGDQSRSQAIVETLNLSVGGNTITAVLVPASSQCTCTAEGPVCEGGVQIADLRINGIQISVSGVNQTINLPGGGTVIINEQISTGSGSTAAITVNALHVNIPGVADVIISSAYSDISCATAQIVQETSSRQER